MMLYPSIVVDNTGYIDFTYLPDRPVHVEVKCLKTIATMDDLCQPQSYAQQTYDRVAFIDGHRQIFCADNYTVKQCRVRVKPGDDDHVEANKELDAFVAMSFPKAKLLYRTQFLHVDSEVQTSDHFIERWYAVEVEKN
jgi:hypothetical protein